MKQEDFKTVIMVQLGFNKLEPDVPFFAVLGSPIVKDLSLKLSKEDFENFKNDILANVKESIENVLKLKTNYQSAINEAVGN